jgi:hypothetical protein
MIRLSQNRNNPLLLDISINQEPTISLTLKEIQTLQSHLYLFLQNYIFDSIKQLQTQPSGETT